MSYFMSINKDRVEITRGHRDAFPYIVKSVDDFNNYFATEAKRLGVPVVTLEVMASSSMDFPDEFTSDAATIALARELR